MAFQFAIPIATTIGGYAIDKMMGGSGMTGAGVGLSAGTMGADGGKGAATGAATTAGGTTPALLASQMQQDKQRMVGQYYLELLMRYH